MCDHGIVGILHHLILERGASRFAKNLKTHDFAPQKTNGWKPEQKGQFNGGLEDYFPCQLGDFQVPC